MGSQICKQENQDYQFSIDPFKSTYQLCQSPELNDSFMRIFQKIKSIKSSSVIDPFINNVNNIKNGQKKWYKSVKYNYKFYGNINGKVRPEGECLIYYQQRLNNINHKQTNRINHNKNDIIYHHMTIKRYPVLITSNLSTSSLQTAQLRFSNNTLVIYNDRSYFIGEMEIKQLNVPKAEGKGLLVTEGFIYEGEFKNGVPDGFGRYRTRNLEYVGSFENGVPAGEFVQRSSEGLFMGILDSGLKKGFRITPENKRIQVNDKLPQIKSQLSNTHQFK